ncbi:MAG: hypothetical protein WCX65_14475 [bacterium]
MAKVARALVSFIDGSFVYVDLAKKIEGKDQSLFCHKIIGVPEGTPADKPTIANAVVRQSKAGACLEMMIPMNRINAIAIQEEFLGKDIPTDMQDLWK